MAPNAIIVSRFISDTLLAAIQYSEIPLKERLTYVYFAAFFLEHEAGSKLSGTLVSIFVIKVELMNLVTEWNFDIWFVIITL